MANGLSQNQDVFNSQELLLCKATDVALRGCYTLHVFFFHLYKVYQIQNKVVQTLIFEGLADGFFYISKLNFVDFIKSILKIFNGRGLKTCNVYYAFLAKLFFGAVFENKKTGFL